MKKQKDIPHQVDAVVMPKIGYCPFCGLAQIRKADKVKIFACNTTSEPKIIRQGPACAKICFLKRWQQAAIDQYPHLEDMNIA
ncbi:MAG: hypothetical protein KG012_15920 [Deltaproteobacteria bacterium]|nr:hypothetical protein [Deltaproteobacteria bacterium]